MSDYEGKNKSFTLDVEKDEEDTNYSELLTKDFEANGVTEVKGKFKSTGGKFQLRSKLLTNEIDEGVANYRIATDLTLEQDLNGFSTRLKSRPGAFQVQADLGTKDVIGGAINPYVRVDFSSNLRNFRPSLGLICYNDHTVGHSLFRYQNKKVNYLGTSTYNNGPWRFVSYKNFTLNGLVLNYYRFVLSWTNKNTEFSLDTGSETAGWKAPDYYQLGLYLKYNDLLSFGAGVKNNAKNLEDRTFNFGLKANLHKNLWGKFAIDDRLRVQKYIYVKPNKATSIGASFEIPLKESDSYKGFLTHGFNFGLKFAFNQ